MLKALKFFKEKSTKITIKLDYDQFNKDIWLMKLKIEIRQVLKESRMRTPSMSESQEYMLCT